MNFSHLASLALMSTTLFGSLPHQVSALSCGISGVTKPCLGDSDVRYDPDVSYDLKTQDVLYEKLDGLYIYKQKQYLGDGTPSSEITFDAVPGATFDFSEYDTFVNLTVSGSRYYYHMYNFVNSNTPGFPGLMVPVDIYHTSTFEKDGSAALLANILGFNEEYETPEERTIIKPVASKALFGVDDTIYQTSYCNDPECSSGHLYTESYIQNEDGESVVAQYTRTMSKKVELEEWMDGIAQTYIDYNIPPPDTPIIDAPNFVQPFDPNGATAHPKFPTGVVFSEDDWKIGGDPNLGTSPYVEPDGVLTGGFIAGVSIGAILVALIIFYFVYKQGIAAREARVKEAVAKSIAKKMKFTSHKALTPAELQTMFNKIDVNGDGSLSKEEIKGLVEEAGVATMSDNDIDILFSSIDFDGNGTLDFTEFAAFFAAIGEKGDSFDDDDVEHAA